MLSNTFKPFQSRSGHNKSKQLRASSKDGFDNPIILLEKSIESEQRASGTSSIRGDDLGESIDQIDHIN